MHYDQGYFELKYRASESVSYDNILDKGIWEWCICQHHIIVIITSLPASHHCQHYVIASIMSLSASHHCQHYQHHITASITSLLASRNCQHHGIASIMSLSASHHCHTILMQGGDLHEWVIALRINGVLHCKTKLYHCWGVAFLGLLMKVFLISYYMQLFESLNLSHWHYYVCTLAYIWLFSSLKQGIKWGFSNSYVIAHMYLYVMTHTHTLSASHHCQHYIIVSITYCLHHAIVNIMSLSPSCHCCHHVLPYLHVKPLTHQYMTMCRI